MNMSPTTRGVLGIVTGIFCIAITVYLARSDGSIYLFPCILGPAIIPLSVALLFLPVPKLFKPTEVDGKSVYDTASMNHTPLGWGLIVLGLLGSGAFYLILSNGF